METKPAIERAIDFIESGLKTKIAIDQIAAQAAWYSPFHFVRVFRALTGETPGSYLRKRRLSAAALELVETRKPIVDIAFEYQFGSHEAFTRSFKQCFGLTPQTHRLKKGYLHLMPRAVLLPRDPGWQEPAEPRCFTEMPISLVGLAFHGDNNGGELGELWRRFEELIPAIPTPVQPVRTFGVWRYPQTFQLARDFDYLAALQVTHSPAHPLGDELAGATLSAGPYLSFTHRGPIYLIRHTYIFIYTEWLPQSGFAIREPFDMECYDRRFKGGMREDSELDLWIPVSPIAQ